MKAREDWFKFRKLKWQDYFRSYVTPREHKKAFRDIPFGQGAKSVYVDGSDGDDSNDGESWKSAKKTIQAGVNAGGSWSNVFVNEGTYTESITVPYSCVHLIGGDKYATKILVPADSNGLTFNEPGCSIENFEISMENVTSHYALICGASHTIIRNVIFIGEDTLSNVAVYIAATDRNQLSQLLSSNFNIHVVIEGIPANKAVHSQIKDCEFAGGAAALALYEDSYYNWFHSNVLYDLSYGIYAPDSATKHNSIFNNNFIDNITTKISSTSSLINVVQNYYYDHTNVDNGFGIATEPYAFTGGSDPRPVVKPDGWLGLSWADADLVAQASVCTEARLAELDAGSIPSDIDTLLSRLTSARAGYLDELDFDLSARLGTPVASLAADIADLITRTKGLDDIHDDLETVDTVVDAILAKESITLLTPEIFRENAATGTAKWPERINNGVLESVGTIFDAVGEYCEIDLSLHRYVALYRLYGCEAMNGAGRWKIQHWNGVAWIDNTTDIPTWPYESWTSWTALTTPVITTKIRFVATTLDLINANMIGELEMKS